MRVNSPAHPQALPQFVIEQTTAIWNRYKQYEQSPSSGRRVWVSLQTRFVGLIALIGDSQCSLLQSSEWKSHVKNLAALGPARFIVVDPTGHEHGASGNQYFSQFGAPGASGL
jgi:hypothetical protein